MLISALNFSEDLRFTHENSIRFACMRLNGTLQLINSNRIIADKIDQERRMEKKKNAAKSLISFIFSGFVASEPSKPIERKWLGCCVR